MGKKLSNIIDFLFRHKIIMIAIAVIIIVLVLIFALNSSSSEKKDTKTEETEEVEELPATTSVKSPKVKEAQKVKSKTVKEKTDKDGNEKAVFYNQANGYQCKIIDGYEVFEGDSGIVYLRKADTTTQIAIIPGDSTYRDGIQLYEQCNQKIYRMSALCRDKDENIVEKTVKNYGTDTKRDKQVGDFAVKYEIGELWLRNTGEFDDVIVYASNYFTTMPDTNKGIILVATSQDVDNKALFADMDKVLGSIKTYVPNTPQLNFVTYTSDGADGMSFQYPEGWTVGKTAKGITYFKAPEDSSNAYAGCIIEYYCDYNKDTVDDYAQYSSVFEGDLLTPTFVQKVAETDFQFNSKIEKIDLNKKIKEKECIYYEILDTIYPASISVKNSLGILRSDIPSRRYGFKASGYNCMLNFIGPKTEPAEKLFQQVLDSVQCN